MERIWCFSSNKYLSRWQKGKEFKRGLLVRLQIIFQGDLRLQIIFQGDRSWLCYRASTKDTGKKILLVFSNI